MFAGRAYVFSGANGGLIYRKDGSGTFVGPGLGRSVSGAGDVDGDGFSDFIFGAPNTMSSLTGFSAGRAYVYSGADGSVIRSVTGANGARLGSSVSGAGDVDGDGFSDYIAGAPSTNLGAGSAFLYSGADGSVIHRINGAGGGDSLGSSVSGVGDVNGDGVPDFVVGAPFADDFGTDAGAAYVVSGATGLAIHELGGSQVSDHFGTSVAAAGDVNGDGTPDIVIGAPLADPGNRTDAGSAYVYSGADGLLIHRVDGVAAGDGLGALQLPVPSDE